MSATRDVVDDAEDDDACVFIASIARVFVRARKPRVPNARESVRRVRTEKKRYEGVLFLTISIYARASSMVRNLGAFVSRR